MTEVPITKTCVKCSKEMDLDMFPGSKSVEIILNGDLISWFEGFLVKQIEYVQNWLKNGIRPRSRRKEFERIADLLSRLLERIRERPHDRLLLVFDRRQIKRLYIEISGYRDHIPDNASYSSARELMEMKIMDPVMDIIRKQAQDSTENECIFCLDYQNHFL